mmetsp:Transcript_121992/g.182167  ORF Transcript_121992/g.182167 Transcript_121992/m.182167 type:complete len:246 (-) Transcript_121992:328-1065(-)
MSALDDIALVLFPKVKDTDARRGHLLTWATAVMVFMLIYMSSSAIAQTGIMLAVVSIGYSHRAELIQMIITIYQTVPERDILDDVLDHLEHPETESSTRKSSTNSGPEGIFDLRSCSSSGRSSPSAPNANPALGRAHANGRVEPVMKAAHAETNHSPHNPFTHKRQSPTTIPPFRQEPARQRIVVTDHTGRTHIMTDPLLHHKLNNTSARCPHGGADCWYCSPSTFEQWMRKRDAGVNPFTGRAH